MSIDFKAMKLAAKAKSAIPGMCAIAVGPSGSGKSSLLGSFPGSILLLHLSDEGHATESASIHGGDVTAVCLDRDGDGDPLTADDTLNRLLTILRDPGISASFQAVGLDSLSSLDLLIKRSQWYDDFCRGSNGKRNDFKSSEAVVTKIQEVFAATERFRQDGTHFMATLAALVKSEVGGEVETVSPVLSSFGAAESLPRLAGSVFYVGRTTIDGESKRALLFNVKMKRDAKDVRGTITKTMSFNARIAGIRDEDIPEALPAHMGKVLEFIKSVKE